jgi:hypothetical protein
MIAARTAAGLGAAATLCSQAVVSLVLTPSGGDIYDGGTADVVNEVLLTGALVLLVGFQLMGLRRQRAWNARAFVLSSLGILLIVSADLVTIAAGEGRWSPVFVVGFALAELGWLMAALVGRSIEPAGMALGFVLMLAYFASAGALALGLACLLLVRASDRSPTLAGSPAGAR